MEEKRLLVKEKFTYGKGWVKVEEYKTVSQIKRMFTSKTPQLNIVTTNFKTGGDYNKELFINEFCKEDFKYYEEFNKDTIKKINNDIMRTEEETEIFGKEIYSAKIEIAWDIEYNDEACTIYLNTFDEKENYIESISIGVGSEYAVYKELKKIIKNFDFDIEVYENRNI